MRPLDRDQPRPQGFSLKKWKNPGDEVASGSMGSWLSVLVNFWFSYSTIFLSAQWRLADPVAFYTRRTTISFGISGYVELVTLYYQAIFWGTEGLGEGCVEIIQIVSCLKLMANLLLFIHNGGI